MNRARGMWVDSLNATGKDESKKSTDFMESRALAERGATFTNNPADRGAVFPARR